MAIFCSDFLSKSMKKRINNTINNIIRNKTTTFEFRKINLNDSLCISFVRSISSISYIGSICTLCLMFLFINQPLQSQEARIWHIEDKNKDTIDFGIVYLGDSTSQQFLLQNYSNRTLNILGKSPSYIRKVVPGDNQFRFLHFLPKNNLDPIFAVNPNEVPDTITILFKDKLVFDGAIGKMEAILEIGLVDLDFPENDKRHLVVADTFLLVGRKTNKLLGSFEDNIKFDSVYINPDFITYKEWNIRNVWTERLNIDKDKYNLLTSKFVKDEIILKTKTIPFELKARSENVKYEVNYKPLDFLPDTVIYKLYYEDIKANDNRIDSAVAIISGVGVKQDLSIIKVDNAITFRRNEDVNEVNSFIIELGNLNINETRDVNLYVENPSLFSNINIGKLGESIIQKYNKSDIINIIKPFLDNNVNLKVGTKDTIQFKFTPLKDGIFEFEYIIQTDLSKRKIIGYTNKNEFIKFIFRGNVPKGQLFTAIDTVSFGSINIAGNCPAFNNQNVEIRNRGTLPVTFRVVTDIDFTGFDFSFDGNNIINQNESKILKLSFAPTIEKNYKSFIYVIYNNGTLEDTLKLNLMGNGLSKLSSMVQISQYFYKPGEQIYIPIISEKNKISLASKFSTVIKFDTTMIKYNSFKTNNTATQNLSLNSEIVFKNDELIINLNNIENRNFMSSDTLILLKFDTYLGDNFESDIVFYNTTIGNENCNTIMDVNISNGLIKIDSVCGLEYKVYNRSNRNKFNLKEPFPNPTSESLALNFDVAFDTEVKIELYNSYGELIKIIENSEYKSGTYQKKYSLSNLSKGIYLLKMQAGLYSKTQLFIKE